MAQFIIYKSKTLIFLRWGTSLFILGILLWILYIFTGQVLCQIALKQIAELTNTKIRAESVNFNTEGSVLIDNLTVSPRKSGNREASIIIARKVYARFNPVSLFLLHPRLKVIDVNDFVFNAQYDLDTGWSNLSELHFKPPENSFRKMPSLLLHNGTLQYSKILGGQAEVAVSMPVDARFGPNNDTSKGYDFEITTATMKSGFGQSRLKGSWKPGIVTVTGGISSSDVPELEMSWLIDVMVAELKYDRNKDFSLKLRIKDLQSKRSESLDRLAMVGSSFLEKSGLFAALHNFFNRYQPRGHVDVELEAAGNLSRLRETTLTGWVDCRDVEILYSGFPYAVQNLVGRIDFTKNNVTFKHLTGRHGDVELSFNGWTRDFGPDHQYEIRIQSDKMPFDHDLYCAMNAKQKKFWDQFSPVGDAAVDLHLNKQPRTEKQTKLELDLHNVEAVYDDFPYPLKNLTGKIYFTNDKVTFSDVVSQENDRLITLNGLIQTDVPMYDMIVNIKNLAMDSTLEAVLPQNQKIFYQKLCPLGLINGGVRIYELKNQPARYYADLYFKNAMVYSEELSSFITDVSARAVFTPDEVDVKRFSGLYGEIPISLTGQIRPDRQQQALYDLSLNLEKVQLNEDFFRLLPKSLKEKVAGLKPAGEVNLDIDLNKTSLTEPPDYTIKVHCQANDINVPNFSNPLKDITGTVIIDENNVELEDLAVSVGDIDPAAGNIASIRLNGNFGLNDGKLTEGFVQLSSDKMSFNKQLKQILPRQARNLYNKLTPSGNFNLDFNDVRIRFENDGQKSVDFAGRINLESCGLDLSGAGMQLKNFVLRTEGTYQTDGGLTQCRLTIDDGQLRVRGKSLSSLEADIGYDPNQQKWFTEDFICDCYGGKTTGKVELKQSDDGSFNYVLQVAFDNVDLKQCLADTNLKHNGESNYTSGKMSGSLSVNTHIAKNMSRIGSLRINIKDMKVGKLSPLSKLLQVLNLTEPSDYAFNQMFMDSYIRDKGLFIEKLDLSGQGFAFYGAGWMDLVSQNIKMTLMARGQRLATDDPSVLQSLTEGLGLAVIQMEVRGTLEEPVIKTKALPVIEGTLQILGKRPKASD